MTFYVCRNGEVIGDWPEEEFRALVSTGQILPDDYFFHEGMTDWGLVSTYTLPDQKEPEGGSKTDTAKAKHDWRLDSATEKQINYLASFGVTAPAEISKGEASDLIERCVNDPQAVARQQQLREVRYEEARRDRASFPSFHLKADIASAVRELEELKESRNKTKAEISRKKKELSAAERKLERAKDSNEKSEIQIEIDNIKSDLEIAELEFSGLPSDLQDAESELKQARLTRINFWKATFRQDWILADKEELLIDFADTIDQLYAEHGNYFKVPTNSK